ncbi:hypothetical protein AJ79_05031 [Helicocarpus griseus UAMH5409]|uniref:RNB domain-containing protein n=1 Tax=Helicocarpus griseus UAMH5409 TaxID=1447875 RepID=A0A2B7XQF4_9EURO|nr:hypothetical protein AJ79_05031 [Helicocarpus griseus UAMH5409]
MVDGNADAPDGYQMPRNAKPDMPFTARPADGKTVPPRLIQTQGKGTISRIFGVSQQEIRRRRQREWDIWLICLEHTRLFFEDETFSVVAEKLSNCDEKWAKAAFSYLLSMRYLTAANAPLKLSTDNSFFKNPEWATKQLKDASPGISDVRETLLKTEIWQAELQGNGDIYDYLRKWQRRNQSLIREMDPVMFPDHVDTTAKTSLKGDMLRDGLMHQESVSEIFDTDEYRHLTAEEDAGSLFLQPGDLVVLKQDSSFADGQLAIYVRSVELQHQFYTVRGKWRTTGQSGIDFVCSKLAKPDEVKPLFPYFPPCRVERSAFSQFGPEGGVPRPVGAHLLEMMMDFQNAADAFHRVHSTILDDLYTKLTSANKLPPIMTLDQITTSALGLNPSELTGPERWAIQRAINRLSFYLISNKLGPFTESYTVRPKEEAKSVATVIRWAREYQGRMKKLAVGEPLRDMGEHPVEQFIQKARQIILSSRRSRSPTAAFSLGPSPRKAASSTATNGNPYFRDEVEPFSANDKIIIDYFRMWTLPPAAMAAGTLRTAGSTILQAIGLYNELRLAAPTGYMFLQELGVFKPWENLHVLYEQLALPGHGISPTADKLREESDKFCESLGPESLPDTMKDLRKDWGDLPVFCVDDIHAAEIDDGFSIEPVPGLDDTYWVHVHVANPSAFITPDHIVGKRAAEFKRSFYSPERVYSMLPSSLVQSRFSLAPNRPVITFSAKVNMAGDILETNITNGYVKNMIFVTPNRVRKLFGIDRGPAPSLTLTFGSNLEGSPRAELQDDIPDEHQSSFFKLERLMAARRERRLEKGALEYANGQTAYPRIYNPKDQDSVYSAHSTVGYHYIGDPAVQFSNLMADMSQMLEPTKEDIVSHIMVLAGEITGQWAKDHKIPLVYTGTWHHPEYKPFTRKTAAIEAPDSFYLGLPRSFSSPDPTPHAALGVDQYVRCTSPLRRFTDLIAHWQIEAVLRQQANGPVSSSQLQECLPFKKPDIETYIARADWQNKLKDRAQTRSRDFWTCLALFRSFYFKAAELPPTLKCVIQAQNFDGSFDLGILENDKDVFYGTLQPFDLQCLVTIDKSASPIKTGDLVDVQLVSIDMYTLRVETKFSQHVKRPENGVLTARGILI